MNNRTYYSQTLEQHEGEEVEVVENPQQTQQLDPAQITAAIQQGFADLRSQQEDTGREREMSPEERAEYFQEWRPDDQYIQSFQAALVSEEATPEQRMAAFTHLRDGIVNQALRGAELLLQRQSQEIQQRFAPASQYAQEQQAEKLWTQFTEKYPDLKDHRDLVDTVSNSMRSSGYQPKSLEDALSSVATMARGIVSKVSGQEVVTTPAVHAAKPTSEPNQKPKMAQTNTNASNGGGSRPPVQPGVASFFLNRSR